MNTRANLIKIRFIYYVPGKKNNNYYLHDYSNKDNTKYINSIIATSGEIRRDGTFHHNDIVYREASLA